MANSSKGLNSQGRKFTRVLKVLIKGPLSIDQGLTMKELASWNSKVIIILIT